MQSLQNLSHQFTHIVGINYSGKTHLLKAWANQHTNSIFIDASEHDIKLNLRDLAQQYHYIAIDNVDRLTTGAQIQLFDLFNTIKLNNRNNYLLTSSSSSLDLLKNMRDDLKTRLQSGVIINLKSLNDNDLIAAMILFTDQEGITIGEIEYNYLITHYTRNIGMLIQALRKLAETSLLAKRNITIPFIKEILFVERPAHGKI